MQFKSTTNILFLILLLTFFSTTTVARGHGNKWPHVATYDTPDTVDSVVQTDSRRLIFKRRITSITPQMNRAGQFIPLDGAVSLLELPSNSDITLDIEWSGLVTCEGQGYLDGCEFKILADGNMTTPKASVPIPRYTRDLPISFQRHICIPRTSHNKSNREVREVEVAAHWGTSNTKSIFRVDDWSLAIEAHRGCHQETIALGPDQIAPTNLIRISANLDAQSTPTQNHSFNSLDGYTYNFSLSVPIYNEDGEAKPLTIYFVLTPLANTWHAYFFVDGKAIDGPLEIVFSNNGQLIVPSDGEFKVSAYLSDYSNNLTTIVVDFTNLVQYGSPFSVTSIDVL